MIEQERTRVFLADDHEMVRAGIALLINREDDMVVVGQCGDGLEVVDAATRIRPEVVVLDLLMPGLGGLDVCRQLREKAPGVGVLILTMLSDEEFIVRALAEGAGGYLLKESVPARLAEGIRTVARDELYLGPGVPRSVLSRLTARGPSDPYDWLTDREREVLQLIAEGHTNRQAAEKLQLAVKTVDTHRARLMRKLDIHDQTALLKYALRRGAVRL